MPEGNQELDRLVVATCEARKQKVSDCISRIVDVSRISHVDHADTAPQEFPAILADMAFDTTQDSCIGTV